MTRKLLRSKIVAVAINLMGILTIVSYTCAETNDNALYIDPKGNVWIGTDDSTITLTAPKIEVLKSVKARNIEATESVKSSDIEAAKSIKSKYIEATESLQAKEITLPSGTTADRPKSPKDGSIRHNTTSNMVEVYFHGTWLSIATTPYLGDSVEYPNAARFNIFKGSVTKKIYSLNNISDESGKDYWIPFTVPKGVKKILIKAWGAGGASGTSTSPPNPWTHGSNGGGGGFSKCILNVNPDETLIIIVGQGGSVHQVGASKTGGGGAGSTANDNRFCGGGGGFSAVVRGKEILLINSTMHPLIVAGGGGGGGLTRLSDFGGNGNSGGAGGGFTGENGYSLYNGNFSCGGTGGGQYLEGGGGFGAVLGAPGNAFFGGTCVNHTFGGGGGGGWRGGGSGGYMEPATMGGGGGGSGHIELGTEGITLSGNGIQCPKQDDPDYQHGIGVGGEGGTSKTGNNGGNGLVVIRW